MRLSEQTLDQLKILSSVNKYLTLKEDSNYIRIINDEMNLFVETYTKEKFPCTVVFDSQKFFGLCSLFEYTDADEKVVEVEFSPKEIVFVAPNKRSSIITIEPKMVSYYPYVDKPMAPTTDKLLEFSLTTKELKELKKVSSILGIEYIAIKSKDGKITISVEDLKKEYYNNPTSDSYENEAVGEVFVDTPVECYVSLQNISSLYVDSYQISLFNINGKFRVLFELDGSFPLKYYMAGLVR